MGPNRPIWLPCGYTDPARVRVSVSAQLVSGLLTSSSSLRDGAAVNSRSGNSRSLHCESVVCLAHVLFAPTRRMWRFAFIDLHSCAGCIEFNRCGPRERAFEFSRVPSISFMDKVTEGSSAIWARVAG